MSDAFAPPPEQEELPFALVRGEPWSEMPKDLYIPPDALEVFLDAFEGPLDLLLYLIKRQNLDILDIPIFKITQQYMEYVELMKELRLELAAEYLVMAAMLAEIKSRMLLPRHEQAEEDEDDPRAELIRRLQEYERFKRAAEDLDGLPRIGRELFQARAEAMAEGAERPPPEVDLQELLLALNAVLKRADLYTRHRVEKEPLSVRERMTRVMEQLTGEFCPFPSLFRADEGRLGAVVTFLAMLELIKEGLVDLVQNETLGAIHLRARAA